MAFILDQLTNVRGPDKALRVQGKWMYRTTDARATVLASDYFLNGYTLVPATDTTTTTSTTSQNCSNKFYVGDTIEVQQVDASGNPVDEYNVLVVIVDEGGSSSIVVSLILPGELVAVGQIADISTASNVTITFGEEVVLTSIMTVLGGPITVADDAITTTIGATPVLGGSLTVAFTGSAKGDVDTATPYAQRTGTAFIVATDGASTGVQTLDVILRGVPTTGGTTEVVTVIIPDISTPASAAYAASPFAGTITRIVSTLQAAITVADANITTNIGATPITGGALVIATVGSAPGTVDSTNPSAANVVTEGGVLNAVSDGGSTTAAQLYVDFYITR